MHFQAINELTKPLASAARTVAKDNTIVMRGPTKSSYIENDATGVRIPIHIENGVYVMSVNLLVEILLTRMRLFEGRHECHRPSGRRREYGKTPNYM